MFWRGSEPLLTHTNGINLRLLAGFRFDLPARKPALKDAPEAFAQGLFRVPEARSRLILMPLLTHTTSPVQSRCRSPLARRPVIRCFSLRPPQSAIRNAPAPLRSRLASGPLPFSPLPGFRPFSAFSAVSAVVVVVTPIDAVLCVPLPCSRGSPAGRCRLPLSFGIGWASHRPPTARARTPERWSRNIRNWDPIKEVKLNPEKTAWRQTG